MTFKSTDKTIEQIGRDLGVSHALEGSVRRAGKRLRITAQLIQVSDQTHLWADSYESDLEDILALQERIAREVAKHIRVTLLAPEKAIRVSAEAYEQTLKGRYLWNRRADNDLKTSIRFFESVIDRYPTYAPAYVGVADCYLTLMDHAQMLPHDATVKARALLAKALDLDESLAEAHVSLGHAAFHEFDWKSAEREFRRGLQLNASTFVAHFYYSNYLAAMGHVSEAIAEASYAAQLDPVSPAAHANLASMFWYARRFDDSVAAAKKVLEFHADYVRAYEDLGRAYEQSGDLDKAIETFRKALSIEENPGTNASLAHSLALAGQTGEATQLLDELHERAKSSFVSAHSFAIATLGLGRTEEALNWLELAYEERSSSTPFLNVNARLDPLRGEKRFQALIRRLGLVATAKTHA